MNKALIAVLAIMVVAAGVAVAHPFWNAGTGPVSHHETMEEIMEEGNFQDLVDYREEIGFNLMPWVVDVATFEQAQERHELMEQYREESGFVRGSGFRRMGGFGGCHS